MNDDPTQRFQWWRDPWWQDVLFPYEPPTASSQSGSCALCGLPRQGRVERGSGVYGHDCNMCRDHCVFNLRRRRSS